MPSASAYLLVFHGSRDPRPQAASVVLAQLFAERLQHRSLAQSFADSQAWDKVVPDDFPTLATTLNPVAAQAELPIVGTASLEFAPQPLHQQIQQLSAKLLQSTPDSDSLAQPTLRLLPLFLLPGVHVSDDIPAEVELARQQVGDQVQIEISPHLGCHPRLRRLLTEQMAPIPCEAWVLLAHGSRRSQANQPIAALAEHLGAGVAYWSVPPSLETCLQAFAAAGLRKIGILPYFLFSGKITDAIAQMTAALALQFPTLDLQLASPLNASPELADLLLDLAVPSAIAGILAHDSAEVTNA